MTETYMKIEDFIQHNVSSMTSKRVQENPNMDSVDMDSVDMDHWQCILRHPCGSMLVVYYSKGYGHKGKEPTAAEVLDCLAVDADMVENTRSFEEWAGDLGYDTDSRKAYKIYETCVKQANGLKSFLGTQYHILLRGVERE